MPWLHLWTHRRLLGDSCPSPCGLCSRPRPRGRQCCPTAPRRQLGLGGCSNLRPWRRSPLGAHLRAMRTICWPRRLQTWRRRSCLPVAGESLGWAYMWARPVAGQAPGGRFWACIRVEGTVSASEASAGTYRWIRGCCDWRWHIFACYRPAGWCCQTHASLARSWPETFGHGLAGAWEEGAVCGHAAC